MTNLITQDEFERRFQGEEIRPHVAHQVDIFLASKDYEYYADFDGDDAKVDSFYKKLERLKFATREKTGTTADADNFPLAQMHKMWKQRDSKGHPNPARSAKFALGVLYYFFREVRNPKYFHAVIESIKDKNWSHKEYNFQRLYFAKHSVSPPWDKFQSVCERFYLPSIEIREGFRQVWSGEPLGPIEQVPLGKFNLLLGLDENVHTRELKSERADPLYVDKEPDVFAALNWRAKLSKLYGRDKQLKSLERWALDGDMQPKIMLISGPGGVGKSRLAGEVAEFLKGKYEWTVGELPNEIGEGDVLNGRGNGVAIIVDYPEEDFDLAERLINACQNSETFPCPVRIILSSRDNLDAWKKRLNDQGLQNISEEPFEYKPYLNKRDSFKVVKEAAEKFGKEVRKPIPKLHGLAEWRSQSAHHSLPLFLVAAGIHAVLYPHCAFTLSGSELLLNLAEIELRRVSKYSKGVLKDDTALQKLLALSLLTSEGLSKEAIYSLGEAGLCKNKSGDALLEAIQKTPYWREKSDNMTSHLVRILPDQPAAALFYVALGMNDPSPSLPDWFVPIMLQESSDFGRILARISADLAQFGGDACTELESAAIEAINREPDMIKGFAGLAFQETSVFSHEFSTKMLMNRAQFTTDELELALVNNQLANHLMLSERWVEALEKSGQAVTLLFGLYETDPRKSGNYLATSLSNNAGIQAALGESGQALQSSKTAISLMFKLIEGRVQVEFDSFYGALSNHARYLSEVEGVHEGIIFLENFIHKLGALDAPDDIRVSVCRAMTLANYALQLESVGRIEEALKHAGQAVSIVEAASSENFHRVLFSRAKLRSIYAELYSANGDKDCASKTAIEALHDWQILAAARPSMFKLSLVKALLFTAILEQESDEFRRAIEICVQVIQFLTEDEIGNFADKLVIKGRCLWVLGSNNLALDENIDAQRSLMRAISVLEDPQLMGNPEAGHNLAIAEDYLSALYTKVGRTRDALKASISCIRSYQCMSEIDFKKRRVDAAASLNNFANRLISLGKFRSAVKFGETSLAMRKDISSESNSIASQAEVAVSLSNLSGVYSQLGQKEAALKYAEAAVEIRRELVQKAPEKFEPKLASALTNLSVCLDDLRYKESAINTSKEAVQIYKRYFLNEPVRYADLISRPLRLYFALCSQSSKGVDAALVNPVLLELKRVALGS